MTGGDLTGRPCGRAEGWGSSASTSACGSSGGSCGSTPGRDGAQNCASRCPSEGENMNRARVLLADDHAIVAEGLVSLLRDEFDLVGTVRDGCALVEAVRELRPDIVVAETHKYQMMQTLRLHTTAELI